MCYYRISDIKILIMRVEMESLTDELTLSGY